MSHALPLDNIISVAPRVLHPSDLPQHAPPELTGLRQTWCDLASSTRFLAEVVSPPLHDVQYSRAQSEHGSFRGVERDRVEGLGRPAAHENFRQHYDSRPDPVDDALHWDQHRPVDRPGQRWTEDRFDAFSHNALQHLSEHRETRGPYVPSDDMYLEPGARPSSAHSRRVISKDLHSPPIVSLRHAEKEPLSMRSHRLSQPNLAPLMPAHRKAQLAESQRPFEQPGQHNQHFNYNPDYSDHPSSLHPVPSAYNFPDAGADRRPMLDEFADSRQLFSDGSVLNTPADYVESESRFRRPVSGMTGQRRSAAAAAAQPLKFHGTMAKQHVYAPPPLDFRANELDELLEAKEASGRRSRTPILPGRPHQR